MIVVKNWLWNNKFENRKDIQYENPCKFISYDSDGDFCTLGKGLGVNSRCWANYGKECKYYSEKKPEKCPYCGK